MSPELSATPPEVQVVLCEQQDQKSLWDVSQWSGVSKSAKQESHRKMKYRWCIEMKQMMNTIPCHKGLKVSIRSHGDGWKSDLKLTSGWNKMLAKTFGCYAAFLIIIFPQTYNTPEITSYPSIYPAAEFICISFRYWPCHFVFTQDTQCSAHTIYILVLGNTSVHDLFLN